MIETIKKLVVKCDPIFVGGVASLFNGYRNDFTEVKDIDIVIPNIDRYGELKTREVSTVFDVGNIRGMGQMDGIVIDVFFTTIKPKYIDTTIIDKVEIRHINKKGQGRYYRKLLSNTTPKLRRILLDKYKQELNYI